MASRSNAQDSGTTTPAELPPSRPLQIFLLVALLVSGAAYVADEWNQVFAPRHQPPDRLHRLVESRSEYAAHMESGLHAMRARQYDQALSQFRLALQAQDSAEAHYNLASALLKLTRPDEALAQFREAVRLNPHYTEVYLAWGQALLTQGKPEEAASVFRDALRVSPNSGLAQFDVALALVAQEKNAQADQRAAEEEGRSADAVTLGAKVERLRTDALQHIAQAQRLGLERPELWLHYGQLLNEEQKFAEAETYLRTAAAGQPDLVEAHFALAVAEDHLAKDADAIGQYEATLVLRPDDPPTLQRLALVYATTTNLDLRSPKMAIQLAIRANDATTGQNPRYLDALARCYAEDADFLQAINWEDRAIHRAGQIHDLALLRELRPRYALFIQHKTN
jgi:tetratricopeptide (TPR) repeat protein